MSEEIHWFVGKEGTSRVRIDCPPFRAFFFWLENGAIVANADFNKIELEEEINKVRLDSKDTREFQLALNKLKS